MKKAIRLDPHTPVVYLHNLGWAYRLAKRYEEAIKYLEEALSINPNYFSSHKELAIINIELGREEEARVEAAEVLKLESNFSIETYRQRTQYKDRALVERDMAALRTAGLPE